MGPISLPTPPPPYSGAGPSVDRNSVSGFFPQQQIQGAYQTQSYIPEPIVYQPPQAAPKLKDEEKTGSVKRFLGDTLVGRFARMSAIVYAWTSSVLNGTRECYTYNDKHSQISVISITLG